MRLRTLPALLLWGLASSGLAQTLPEVLRDCADRFDARQRVEASVPAGPGEKRSEKVDAEASDVPLMSLALDCPEAIEGIGVSGLDGLAIETRRMMTLDWRALAATLEHAEAAPPTAPAEGADARLAAILADIEPAPLTGLEGRVLWRERLRAWALRQLRNLFGPDTKLGRWLESLTADDLRAFSDGVLAVVLVLFAGLLAALGLLLYRFLGRRRGGASRRHAVELPEGLADVPLLPVERIRTLPPAQQPLALMRLVLARIDERGLCSVRGSMTNSEVAAALAAAAGLRIDDLSRLADRCLFGGHEATDADVATCWAEVDALGVQQT